MRTSDASKARLVARNQSVVEKYKAGVVVEELVKTFFLSRPAVCKILKEAGLIAPRKVRKDANKTKSFRSRPEKTAFKHCKIIVGASIGQMEILIEQYVSNGWTLQGGLLRIAEIGGEDTYYQIALK